MEAMPSSRDDALLLDAEPLGCRQAALKLAAIVVPWTAYIRSVSQETIVAASGTAGFSVIGPSQ
jgi:hypothetical protein